MTMLDRYLIAAVFSGTAMVLLGLLAVAGFVNFIGQVDNVGTGAYTLGDSIIYVLLTLPRQAYEMLPVAALLGGLLGLGTLATHSELIAFRSAGVSVWRMAVSVSLAGLMLVLLTAALGELIAPPAEQYAKRHRTLAMHKQLSMAGGQSGWIKDGDLIVNIEQLIDRDRTGGIFLFEFDAQRQLRRVGSARSSDLTGGETWELQDFRETVFGADGLTTRRALRSNQATSLSPDLLGLSVVDPDSLAARGLMDYARYLSQNDLDPARYQSAFWSRIAGTVSVFLMAVLALPFVFGSLRAAGTGQRMLIGILIGFGYYVGTQLLSNSGTVYGLNPVLTGWLPTLVLAALVVVLLARVR